MGVGVYVSGIDAQRYQGLPHRMLTALALGPCAYGVSGVRAFVDPIRDMVQHTHVKRSFMV